MDKASFTSCASELKNSLTPEECTELLQYRGNVDNQASYDRPQFLAERQDCPGNQKQDRETPKMPLLTLALLEGYLAESGISVRYNVISKAVEIAGVSKKFNLETLTADLHIILHDTLKQQFRCSKDLIADLLGIIAGKNRFNPVLDLLDATAWDGVDRMRELYEILHIKDDDSLSKTLLSKWCCQCVAMAKNSLTDAYGADGMLVLQGPQGIGKTSFVRHMGMRPDLFKLGQYIDVRDKDTSRRCTSAWIVELGEVETTLRSDLERLKAFITNEVDEYRLPYGRADQTQARRTSLIATCNSTRFLIDPTGSRRFWTIPVEAIDLDRLRQFDALQLWAEVKSWVDRNPQGFRLTRKEQNELALRNTAHEKPLKAQIEVEDILTDAAENKNGYAWRHGTVSDFKSENTALARYSAEQIGKALTKLGFDVTRKKVNGHTISLRYLPFRKWS